MNIGIDIDNTITNTREMIYHYAQQFSMENKLEILQDLKEYKIEKSLGWSQQVAYQFLATYLPSIYQDVRPKDDAVQVIRDLHREHRIILITARNERDQEVTKKTLQWLCDYGIEYDKLVMNHTENMHHFSKLAACLEERIDVMIEDHHELCLELSEHFPVLIFDQPYNQHVESEKIIRVMNWLEVKTWFEKISVTSGKDTRNS